MGQLIRSIGIALLILLAFAAPLRAAAPVLLDPLTGHHPLGMHLDYLEDPGGQLTLEDVLAPELAQHFQPSRIETPNFGLTRSTYWFRFTLHWPQAARGRWLLVLGYPLLDRFWLYFPDSKGGYAVRQGGDYLPFAQGRDLQHRMFSFHLPRELPEVATLHLRVTSEGSVQVPLALWTADRFAEQSFRQVFGHGLYFGTVLVMAFYNLFLYFALRGRSYLYYVLYISLSGLLLLSINGFGFQFLWPDSPWMANHLLLLFAHATSCFAYAFTASFLNTRKLLPRWYRLLRSMILIQAVLGAISMATTYAVGVRLTVVTAFAGSAILLGAGIAAWRSGYRPARYFLLAWVVLLLGGMAYQLKSFGFLPAVFLTEYAFQIGSALEVVLLSFALADRISLLRKQKEAAETASLRKWTQELEEKVQERTAELRASHTDLQATHRRLVETQQQLVQQEKMAALGTLTAGVAHEINNPMNFADVSAQNLRAELEDLHHFLIELAGEQAPEVLGAFEERFSTLAEMNATTREGLKRIKSIVLDLRQFTRLDEAERKSVPIAEPIQSTVNLIRTRFERIEFRLNLDFNPSIECQPAKLGQLFMNLVVNACEAIERVGDSRKGVVSIQTRSIANDEVEIAVFDNGCGIAATISEHVFEPFFTTKPVGAGTGLGLAIAFGIVKEHGGSIDFESTPGQGTRFNVVLPMDHR